MALDHPAITFNPTRITINPLRPRQGELNVKLLSASHRQRINEISAR
jgi:hypothetical protein